MKKTIYIILLIIVSTITYVQAQNIEKTLLTIDNCYNISIRTHLDSGNQSYPLFFKSCTLVTGTLLNGYWTCDCYNTKNNNITIITDKYSRKSIFSLDIQYTTYKLTDYKGQNILFDYGDYASLKGGIDEYERTKLCIPTKEYIYRNITKTIYVPNITYQERIIQNITYIDKEVPVYYINNTYIEEQKNNIHLLINLSNEKDIIYLNQKHLIYYQIRIIILFLIYLAISIIFIIVLTKKNESLRRQ